MPTLALLIADSLFGAWLMRSQGRAVWTRFQDTMQAGRIPHREVFDGVLVIFGGAFLITPGFITDVAGVLLLAPPTRSLIRRFLIRRGGKMFGITFLGRAAGMAPGRQAPPPDYDVEGTAHETDQPRLPR